VGVVQYPTAKSAIIALVNRNPRPPPGAYDPHLTFDRYFRIGRYAPQPGIYFDPVLHFKSDPVNQVSIRALEVESRLDSSLAVHTPKLGVDLEGRYIEVRKLFFAGFARRVLRMGYDPEDVLQELLTGLLVRNAGKCPFNPNKSSFSHYIHMVAECILSNYRRRYSRLERNESFGHMSVSGEIVDVAEADLIAVEASQEDTSRLSEALREIEPLFQQAAASEGVLPDTASFVFGYLTERRTYKEIGTLVGLSSGVVSKLAKILHRVAALWASGSIESAR